jgi:tetratricopeptide (TPR) repeat protein
MRTTTALAIGLLLLSPGAIAAPEAPRAGVVRAASVSPHADELDALFARLKVASDAGEAGKIEARIWELWLDSGDPHVNQLMDYAIAAVDAHAYGLAINYLDTVIVTKPDYAEGWNKRATVYWLMHDYDKSLADIASTLALEPRHWGALAGLGMIMRDLGANQKAVDAFKQALAIDPNLDDVKVGLELLEDKLGKGI